MALPIALAMGITNADSAARIAKTVPNGKDVMEAAAVIAAKLEYAAEHQEIMEGIRGVQPGELSVGDRTILNYSVCNAYSFVKAESVFRG